jgi:hypothetical protein
VTGDERRSLFSPLPASHRVPSNLSRRTLAITAGWPDPAPDALPNPPTVPGDAVTCIAPSSGMSLTFSATGTNTEADLSDANGVSAKPRS